MKGPQADVGAGWWGKLYEEHGRGLLWDKSGEKHVKAGRLERLRDRGRGQPRSGRGSTASCASTWTTPSARRGIFALQLHSGGPMEVRFKDLKLELIPPQ